MNGPLARLTALTAREVDDFAGYHPEDRRTLQAFADEGFTIITIDGADGAQPTPAASTGAE